MQIKWPEPAWIEELPQDQRKAGRIRFYLNLAATHFSEAGSLSELSRGIGHPPSALFASRQRGNVAPEMAVKLESALGRDRFPRELFNDIFAISER